MASNRTDTLYDYIIILSHNATIYTKEYNLEDEEEELIEIGVCFLDLRWLKVIANQSLYVKPVLSLITPKCTEKTGITPEVVASKGRTLEETFSILENDYKIHRRGWGTWGLRSKRFINKEAEKKELAFVGNWSSHFNIQDLVSMEACCGWGESLQRALERRGLQYEGDPRKAADRARNIARLYVNHLKTIRVTFARF